MSNACGRKGAQRIQKPSFFRVKRVVIGEVDKTDSRRSHDLCKLRRRAVQPNLTGVIRQGALAIDKNQIRCAESGGQQSQRVA